MRVTRSRNYDLLADFLGLFFLALGLVAAAAAQADSAPAEPPPPPGGGTMVHGQGPGAAGNVMYLGLGEGKQVKGAPMSGDFVVNRDTTLADGTHIHNVSQTKMYRDAEGRVRREIGIDLNMPATGAVKHTMIVIIDPVGGYRYMLNPGNKTARQMPLRSSGHNKGDEAPEEAEAPGEHVRRHMAIADSTSVKTEDLGMKAVNGIQAQGTRVTRTIAAGEIGNDKPIQVVTERWVSVELQVPLLVTHNDPLMGIVTSTLTNLTRGDQDSSLFQVPPEYKLERGRPSEPFFVPMH